jgi:phosphatidylglycerophosphatase A
MWLILAALLLTCIIAVPLGYWAERHWGVHDPKYFVLDEVGGFLLTVLIWRTDQLPVTIVWAFLAARIADIIKPPPARTLEKLPGGWGILLDDLMSSVYAALALHLGMFYWPKLFLLNQ